MRYNLHNGDCLEVLKSLGDASVDMCLTDLPYNVTNRGSKSGEWDNLIPFELLWPELERVVKENGAIVLFGQGLFSARMIMSNPSHYRYSLVWDKKTPSGFLNANRMPLREHEDICIFYRKQPTFNPQMKPCSANEVVHSRGRLDKPLTNQCYGKRVEFESKVRLEKCPTSILHFPKPHHKGQHPTEKPVDLCRWLIRTYTNEGETVLDATMGSGTTGVAAAIEHRLFVGIEKDSGYFETARKRIAAACDSPKQGELF